MFQQTNKYLESLREPRNLVDIALVFLLVYALLRLIRGTRPEVAERQGMEGREGCQGAAETGRNSR